MFDQKVVKTENTKQAIKATENGEVMVLLKCHKPGEECPTLSFEDFAREDLRKPNPGKIPVAYV